MHDKIGYLETKNKVYPFVFNVNVLEDLQDEYGSFQKWVDTVGNTINGDKSVEPRIKDIKRALMLMINEGIDIENESSDEKQEFVNERQVGRIMSAVGQDKIVDEMMKLIKESTEVDENSKNV